MKCKSQSAIETLGENAQLMLHRMLDQQSSPERIAQQLWLQTKVDVTAEAITRYAFHYHKRQQELRQARAGVDGLIGRAQQQAATISDLLRAVLLERLSSSHHPSLVNLDVLKLEAAERQRTGLELRQKQAEAATAFRERELELKERQVQVAEGRFRMDRRKVRAFLATLESKAARGRPVTTLDVRKVRELYGLEEMETNEQDRAETEA